MVLTQFYWPLSPGKDYLSRYGNFHYKEKTVVRKSYLYNGNPYIVKMASLYWDSPLEYFRFSTIQYKYVVLPVKESPLQRSEALIFLLKQAPEILSTNRHLDNPRISSPLWHTILVLAIVNHPSHPQQPSSWQACEQWCSHVTVSPKHHVLDVNSNSMPVTCQPLRNAIAI